MCVLHVKLGNPAFHFGWPLWLALLVAWGTACPGEESPSVSSPEPAGYLAAVEHRQRAQTLIAELASAADERAQSIEDELAGLGSQVLVALKLAELNDDFELRRQARRVGSRLRWRLAVKPTLIEQYPDLVDTMAGDDGDARVALVDRIIDSPDHTTLGFLAECLADGHPYVRQRAINGLVRATRNSEGIRPEVVDLLENRLHDDDRDIQMLAISGLSSLRAVDLEAFAPLLNHPSGELRSTAILTMGHSGQPQAVPHITRMLTDPQWRIRVAALDALEDLESTSQPKEIGTAVLPLLGDPDPFVQAKAVELVGRLQYRDAVPALLEMMESGKIQEVIGVKALVRMSHGDGRSLLLKRYRAAITDDERREWLSLMEDFDQDEQINKLLLGILNAPERRGLWPYVLTTSRQRLGNRPLFDRVAELLLEEDVVARSAWQSIQHWLRSTPLSPLILARLAESSYDKHRQWALEALYIQESEELNAHILRSFGDPSPKVINLALGIVGQERFGDWLEVKMSRSMLRRSETHDHVHPPTSWDDWKEPVCTLLAHADGTVRVRAAALLYLAGIDRVPAVERVLGEAISGDDPDRQAIALAGMTQDPGTFLDDVDLMALSKKPPTRARALSAMAVAGDPKYMAHLLQQASPADPADEDNDVLWTALIRSGDPSALAVVQSKFEDIDAGGVVRFVDQLADMPGDGPVQFIVELLDRFEDNRDYRHELVATLVTLPDDFAVPVLKNLVKNKADDDWYGTGQFVMSRLVEVDLDHVVLHYMKMLVSGGRDLQREAIVGIVSLEPEQQLVDLVRRASQTRLEDVDPQWSWFARWLPFDTLRNEFLPVLGKLNPPMQHGIVDRLEVDAVFDDVSSLLAVQTSDFRLRARLAGLVAQLTCHRPQTRSAMKGQDTGALSILLSAAGEWPEGREVLRRYLGRSEKDVVNAACRGLALHLLSVPGEMIDDAERDALIRAVEAKDPFTSYLAVEALLQRDASQLQRISMDAIVYPGARLRCVMGRTDQVMKLHNLRSILTGRSASTPHRMAVALGVLRSDLEMHRLIGSHLHLWRDLIQAAAIETGDSQLLELLVLNRMLDAAAPWPSKAVASLVARAREDETTTFWSLVQGGFISEPDEGDVLRLLRVMSESEFWSYGGDWPWQDDPTSPLDHALIWVGAESHPRVIEAIGTKGVVGVAAAVVASLAWQEDSALDILLEVATAKVGAGAFPGTRAASMRDMALAGLAVSGRPSDIEALAAFDRTLDRENDWQAMTVKGDVRMTIAALSPRVGHELFEVDEVEFMDDDDKELALTVAEIVGDEEEMELEDDGFPFALPGGLRLANDYLHAERAWRSLARRLEWIRKGDTKVAPEFAERKLGMPGLTHRQTMVQFQSFGYVIDSNEELDDSTFAHMDDDPFAFYLGHSDPDALAAIYLDRKTVILALGERLEDPSVPVRIRAMRTASRWQLPSLADAIDRRLKDATTADEIVEAAWALAHMQGRQALASIRAARAELESFDARVSVASLLRLLGDSNGYEDIERAASLFIARRLRARALTLNAPKAPTGSSKRKRRRALISTIFGPDRSNDGPSVEPDFEEMMMWREDARAAPASVPWGQVLSYAAVNELAARERRLVMAPFTVEHAAWLAGSPSRRSRPSVAVDLSGLHLGRAGWLVVPHGHGNRLPVRPLVTESRVDLPIMARLAAAEQALERLVFVQLADGVETLPELRDRWHEWWRDYREADPIEWWRQAVTGAIRELTHDRWWLRLRGASRLRRLTGRNLQVPAHHDLASWEGIQIEWQNWFGQTENQDPRRVLMAAVREAGMLEDFRGLAADEHFYLAGLVRLAGWARPPLSDAALLQLETWPDTDQLLRAALVWQHAPRRELAQWAKSRANQATGLRRIIYSSEDLDAAAR